MKTILFFYLMDNEEDKIKITAPKHSEYWNNQNLVNYSGGPFSDFSGGCITFSTDSFDTANKIAMQDPFVTENCLKSYWLKEWLI